jgi:hypothetical protein
VRRSAPAPVAALPHFAIAGKGGQQWAETRIS